MYCIRARDHHSHDNHEALQCLDITMCTISHHILCILSHYVSQQLQDTEVVSGFGSGLGLKCVYPVYAMHAMRWRVMTKMYRLNNQ